MKKFGKILAMVMVALMMMSVVAFAEANADGVSSAPTVGEDDLVTVVLSGLEIGEEATILVVNEGVALSSITSENASSTILYIDQLTAVAADDGETGTVSFTLDASAAAVSEDEETVGRKAIDVYCGYTNMTVADPVMATVVLAEGGQTTPEVVYGDVDGVDGISLNDAIVALSISTGAIEGSTEQLKAADVDGVDGVSLNDAITILNKSTGLIDKFPVEE